jgi:hypothetical protein
MKNCMMSWTLCYTSERSLYAPWECEYGFASIKEADDRHSEIGGSGYSTILGINNCMPEFIQKYWARQELNKMSGRIHSFTKRKQNIRGNQE